MADLKRRVGAIEKEVKRLGALLARIPQPQSETTGAQKTRITGKGMRSLRRKLWPNGQQFAGLLSRVRSDHVLTNRCTPAQGHSVSLSISGTHCQCHVPKRRAAANNAP